MLLAMTSKCVGCSRFLPTMEIDSYRERGSDSYREGDNQKATDKEREHKLENKLQRDRA